MVAINQRLGKVTIRRWAETDAPALAAMYRRHRDEISASEPWRTAGHFTSRGQRLRVRRAARADPPFIGWLILEDGTLAGTAGLDDVIGDTATLGYWIDHSRRGRGLATAAAGLVLAEAFTVMGLGHVVANALPDNGASLAVLRRLGFHRIGDVNLHVGGRHVRFVLSRPVWELKRTGRETAP
jgi:[ribosomal protein S5]-alanine N-acetyltransferase